MEPKPVERAPEPNYPTRQEVAGDRDFLPRHLPPLWRFTGAASIALALHFAGLGAEPGPKPDTPAVKGQAQARRTGAMVAPVFEHGSGRGAIGCVVVSPPVFLAEDEAMAVLREELGKHGVRFSRQHVALMDVVIPRRVLGWRDVDGQFREEVKESKEKGNTLVLDQVDEEKKIAIEFVSRQDYGVLGGPQGTSTVSSYNMLGVARSVATQVKKDARESIKLGIFYDPLCQYQTDAVTKEEWEKDHRAAWDKARAASVAKSKDLLRRQAQDFVNWLKEQKAL